MNAKANIAVAAVASVGAAVVAYVAMRPKPPDPRVRQIAVSLASGRAAAALGDGRVFTWPLDGSAEPTTNLRAAGGIDDLQFTPDGGRIAVAGDGIAIGTWDRKTVPEPLREGGERYGMVSFNALGARVATVSGKGEILVLPVAGGEPAAMCCATIYGDVRWLPDGKHVVSAGHWPAVWNTASGKLVARLTREREFMTMGPVVVLAARNEVLIGSQDGGIRAWSLLDFRQTASSPRTPDWVETMAVRPGTDWIAYAQRGRSVRWWNRSTGERRDWAAVRTESTLAFTSLGRLLTGTADGRVEEWNADSGERTREWRLLGNPGVQ